MSKEDNYALVIRYGSENIPFELAFRPRRELAISVHPDRSVKVVAPETRSVEEVLARVRRKAAWIAKQRRHFEKFHPLPHARRFVNGETHYYLGRQYRLRIRAATEESVKLTGRFLTIETPHTNDGKRSKALLDAWYRDHAETIFRSRLLCCLKEAPSLRMPPPQIVILRMAKRWGSCTQKGNILVNVELVKTPLDCIEYLLMHELCHLHVHNHGPAYYRLLTRCMPDWQRRKSRLDSFVI
ncbi:MAG: M48 family metallopeptidase [Elusimicrobiota bacterium]